MKTKGFNDQRPFMHGAKCRNFILSEGVKFRKKNETDRVAQQTRQRKRVSKLKTLITVYSYVV